MKSSMCRLRAAAMKRAVACLCVLICLCSWALAAQPAPDDGDGSRLRIVAPYAEGAMPTAEQVLTKCVQRLNAAKAWQAKITLQAAAEDADAQGTYVGELQVDEGGLRASLRSTAEAKRTVRLQASDKQLVAWFVPEANGPGDNAGGDRAGLQRVAGCVQLLDFVGALPGDPPSVSEIAKTHRLANRGMAKLGQHEVYVLEVEPNKADSAVGKPLLIAISVADSLPVQLSRVAEAGCGMIKFDSIDLKATSRERSPVKPPKGAVVMDLKPDESTASGLKNPIPYGPESIARGKRLYVADCVVCHSIDGTGQDSDVTDNAADLTDTTHWLSDGSEAATFLAIRDGAGDEMPGYADEYGDDKPMWDLVNYLRSLRKKK